MESQYYVYILAETITREKQIKKWNRDWKINLIQSLNPDWHDLYESIIQ